MLRSIFVVILLLVGAYFALHSAYGALLFYIGLSYFRPEQWLWYDFTSQLNLYFIVGAYLSFITLFSRQKFVFNIRIFILFLFLIYAFITVIFSHNTDFSMHYWLNFLRTIVISYVMIVLTQDFQRYRLLLLVIALALGLEGAKQGWAHLVTSPAGPNTNRVPFLGDNNGVGVGMLMLAPLLVFLGQTALQKKTKYFFWFLFVGVLYRALSTHSRGAFLACLALGGVYWLRSSRKFRGLIAASLTVLIILPALPEAFWERMQTIQEISQESQEEASADSNDGDTVSTRGRLHFWSVALVMANANPLTGVGFNAYQTAYDNYDFSDGWYGRGRAAHSSYFGALADLGYPGALLFGLNLFGSFYSLHRVRRLTRHRTDLLHFQQSAAALEASLVAACVGIAFLSYHYSEILWHFISLSIILENITLHYIQEAFISQRIQSASDKAVVY